jgi:uncharacterized iron-regulated membrane protein
MPSHAEQPTVVRAKARRWVRRVKPLAILIHRWVGLVMATFLIVAGLTGSMMAFYPELDAMLNPTLYRVTPPSPDAPLLDPFTLRDRVADQFPAEHNPSGVVLELEPGKTVNYWIDDHETFIDPYTAEITGRRQFGHISEGRVNLLTFLYELHFSLALGDVGTWIFGIVAILWTLDCFVGAYLTFPTTSPADGGSPRKAWWVRWLPAWTVKTTKLFSFVFTWHRASGLWVWGLLLVFAWSAVALNLGEQIYDPIMKVVIGPHEHEELPELDPPRNAPALDLRAAHLIAQRLIQEQATMRGFQVIGERWLDHMADHGAYAYTVESTLDVGARLAETTVLFDSNDGRLLDFHAPTSLGARGTFDAWLIALHFGTVRELGLAYRAFVCVLGFLVTALSVTGVWIWWRKRAKTAHRVRLG